MFADEIAYRAVMNNLGIDALMNADEMMRYSAGIAASEYMQMLGIADITANNPALESIQSELEKMQSMQTSLEQAMNSPVLEAIRNNDRIFAGVNGGLLDIGPKIISGLEEMNGIASLKSSLGGAIDSYTVDWTNCVAAGSAMTSIENDLAKNLVDEMDLQRLPKLTMIEPYRSGLPDLLPLPPISREVTLSPETIEMLADKIAEKGGRIEITATQRSVVIAGNASNSLIDTGTKGSNKKS